MADPKDFCSCTDTKCPNHPTNHDKGCSLCVAKCLRQGEIPGCFFNVVDPTKEKRTGYTYEAFAKAVLSD